MTDTKFIMNEQVLLQVPHGTELCKVLGIFIHDNGDVVYKLSQHEKDRWYYEKELTKFT